MSPSQPPPSARAAIQPIVVGTAGHIDHGKSTLVRALTGVDPDRLKEEKERGLTIDLGFAPLVLPDGRKVGIVDVPGHERFIRNMVAGASGIDLVVLVVAADDGVMPQTREHLSIMEVLGVSRGFVALTKTDLVEPDLAELAAEDVREALAGTFLEGAPVLPVSAVTGAGLEALKELLFALAADAPPRSDEGLFRMPIQRVFSAKGFGTVVTGIPVSGAVAVGDTVELLPLGRRAKVRGLQAYKETAERARAGHSTAINLADVDHHAVHRGMVVATPGFFRPARMVGARLRAARDLGFPITNRMRVRLHTGTAEEVGEVVLLDREELAPGEEGLAQLRLDEAIVCAPGDRFVLRLASPLVTLGGGTIVEESRHRLKRFKRFVIDELRDQEESLGSLDELVRVTLARQGRALVAVDELAVLVKRDRAEVAAALERLRGLGRAAAPGAAPGAGAGARWIHAEHLAELEGDALAAIEGWFAKHAHREVLDVRELRALLGLESALLDAVLAELDRAGRVERAAGGKLSLAGRSARLDPETETLRASVLAHLAAGAFQPPDEDGLAELTGAPRAEVARVTELLVDRGEAARIAPGYVPAGTRLAEARAAVVANCERNGKLVIPELRDVLRTSRKFLIPLLEHLDAQGVTLRQGGHRVLRRR